MSDIVIDDLTHFKKIEELIEVLKNTEKD